MHDRRRYVRRGAGHNGSKAMLDWFFGPKIFNVVIMVMYAMAIAWWAAHGKWVDSAYWFFAFGITAVVTFWYRH